MDWLNLLEEIFKVCLIPLLGVLTTYIIKYISNITKSMIENNDKKNIDKYITLLEEIVTECVIATNQTYVDALKKQNAFDLEAQKTAFKMTYDAVLSILTEEAKECLELMYGDLAAYIKQKIEAEVKKNK